MLPLTLKVLRDPERALRLGPDDWTRLVLEARDAGLLARLGARLEKHGLLTEIPDGPRRHLEGMARYAAKLHTDILAEIGFVRDALASRGIDLVLMKGAAYVAAESPAAEGRIFEDIDLLVPEPQIAKAEEALVEAGWTRPALDAHDTRYYYEWMHQIPPLVHRERGSLVDVHHNIVPRTAKPRIDAHKLLAEATPTSVPGVYTLSPTDLLLHSAVHLFNDGDFTSGLRDLSDMDLMLTARATDQNTAGLLGERARDLGLTRPASDALNLCRRLFQTPFPPPVNGSEARRGRLAEWLLHKCFAQAVQPLTSSPDSWPALARFALYIRGHVLKMPLHLLIPHLVFKTYRNALSKS